MLNIAGGLAIMAWLCVINIGYIIARYYKPLWSGKKVLGADIWFLVNFVVYSRLFVIVLIVDIIELHVYKHVQILMHPTIIFFRLKFQNIFRQQAIFYQHRIVQLIMHTTICSKFKLQDFFRKYAISLYVYKTVQLMISFCLEQCSIRCVHGLFSYISKMTPVP